MKLFDLWRILHPSERDYTFFSPVHKTHSRLDYIFVSQSLLDTTPTISIKPKIWSDHSPVFCHLNFAELRARNRSWQLNDN